MNNVRVRFAPSPTGGLHLGGVRTVLYNYLFAKKHKGKFIVRIEDTDQTRYVEGAEQYIFDCLNWCGLVPDESVITGGPFAPYRQSERKEIYREYAEKLVSEGKAYYAFDTHEEIEKMRDRLKSADSHSLQYDHRSRNNMRNSLSLSGAETASLLASQTPHVIRIKIDPGKSVGFSDMIRGELHFDLDHVDDKVLLKADGMPTYHLAVVVDDYLMKITHAFRGEEWLPSAPVHILLWQSLFGADAMPQWAHLPLILKPDGNGKLSKRDGDRLGFPVYAMDWDDPKTGDHTSGFKELGFLPEAFLNMLAMLGWNAGTEQEIFSLAELISAFSMDRVHKGGAKFDYEKAKWFNHEYIKAASAEKLSASVRIVLEKNGIANIDEKKLLHAIDLVKERCTLIPDFYKQASYFFKAPENPELDDVQAKWNEKKAVFFKDLVTRFAETVIFNAAGLEADFKLLAEQHGIKPGELLLPLRIILAGGKFGPAVFQIAAAIGKEETISRIRNSIHKLG